MKGARWIVATFVLGGLAALGSCQDAQPEGPIGGDGWDVAEDVLSPADISQHEDLPRALPDSGATEISAPPDLPDLQDPDGADVPVETGPGLGLDYAAHPGGPFALFDLTSDSWLATGWPSDRLRGPDGKVDLLGFPNPLQSDLFTSYLALGSTALDGFGLNGGIYVELNGPVDLANIPDPAASRDALSLIQMVDVTPESPTYGDRVPISIHLHSGTSDPYYAPNTLVMRPYFGIPLREGTTYCAVVTRGLVDMDGRYLQPSPGFTAGLSSLPWLAPLNHWLNESPLHRSDLAMATCFTTQGATSELRAVAEALAVSEPPVVEVVYEPNNYNEFHGLYTAPNYQAGEKPYVTGGGIEVGQDGIPIVQAQELIRYLLLVPRGQSMPEAGWPIVIYAHGTGGDYESCRSSAADVAVGGMAMLCMDQNLHGIRGPATGPLTDDELVTYSFNFINPHAGRGGFRQAAIDVLIQSRMVEAGRFDLGAADTLSGQPVVLDPERVLFLGHSHGALAGALALGVESRIRVAVISGGGALLLNTILLRKDPLDIGALVGAVLGIAPDMLDSFHPALSMVQMLVDATDPVNYAPYWLGDGEASEGKHVFMTEGTADHASPQLTGDTLAAAARLPIIGPIAKSSPAHALLGLSQLALPVTLNAVTPSGPRTAAMRQWQDGTHWVAFDVADARALWRHFLNSAAGDQAPEVALGPADAPPTVPSSGFGTPGETCADALNIPAAALPTRISGNTTLAADDTGTAACGGGPDVAQRDVAFSFTADVSGRYRFALSVLPKGKDDPPTGPDRVAVAGSCLDLGGTCRGSGSGNVDVDLIQGETVYAIVDGTTGAHRGPFDLTVSRLCATTACGAAVCGQVGCGSCGSCESGAVCEGGQCVATPPGDRCGSAMAIGSLPFAHAGSTVGFGADYGFDNSVCPGSSTGYGKASRDVVFVFTPLETRAYRLELDTAVDSALYVVSDCSKIATTCLAGQRRSSQDEVLSLTLPAGSPVFIVVDGASNTSDLAGAYVLRVSTCVPDCAGKACGGDGCGGTCGECGAEERCLSETVCDPIPYVCTTTTACEAVPAGDRCSHPTAITSVPFDGSGATTDLFDDYGVTGGACPGFSKSFGGVSNDAAYRLTAPADGIYHLSLDATFDTLLYIVSDCAAVDTSCAAGSQLEKKKGGESLYVALTAGQTVFFIVDGAALTTDAGTFTLHVETCAPSCDEKVCGSDGCGGTCGGCSATQGCSGGKCVPKIGDDCPDPQVVGDLPYKHDSSTLNLTSGFEAICQDSPPDGPASSPDAVYRFDPPGDATYRFSLAAALDLELTVIGATCGGEGACLGTVPPGQPLDVALLEGTPAFVVIDGAVSSLTPVAGAFTLRVEVACYPACDGLDCGSDGCGGTCGTCTPPADECGPDQLCIAPSDTLGNTCVAPFEVDLSVSPFVASGDTSTALNHYRFSDYECGTWAGKGGAARDQAWRLVAPEAGTYTFRLDASAFDAVLYLVNDCKDIAATCRDTADGPAPEQVTMTLAAGETVYAIVDGASNTSDASGPYTLTVRQD